MERLHWYLILVEGSYEGMLRIEKKTKKLQKIKLNSKYSSDLKSYIKRNGLEDGEYLFQSWKGGPITTRQAQRELDSIGKELGLINFTSHSLKKHSDTFHTRKVKVIYRY